MRKNKWKIVSVLLIILSLISIQINTYTHSGRTDANGGHKDNKNKSGLGSYHYHCGGYPAHLHPNGVCPYSSSSSSSKSSTSSSSNSKQSSSLSSKSSSSSASNSSSSTSSSSLNKTSVTTPATIDVEEIKINENIDNIEVGKSEKLTVTITPNNATDRNVVWKSSDESIATINSLGEITAKKPGTINVTASTSNGKTSTIMIKVTEERKVENNVGTNTVGVSKDDASGSNTVNKQDDSGVIGGILTLGVLGGGSYLGYKKYKKSK